MYSFAIDFYVNAELKLVSLKIITTSSLISIAVIGVNKRVRF